ncbi:MAG: carboxymuconolactone decarboxylase family protein [Candidatus Sulfotelmatobacter sp.]
MENTTDLLFRDLWQRPALAPRDRSLITVSALIANGQTAPISYHLGRVICSASARTTKFKFCALRSPCCRPSNAQSPPGFRRHRTPGRALGFCRKTKRPRPEGRGT